ncbi:MAG: hypothetical protein ABSC31_14410 [Acidimicrobiales bacterium]
MNDFLVVYLDSIDERLLEYLDEDDELKLDAVQRLSFYTTALLDGSITPEHIAEDWSDWYQLVPAFVATYGPDELQELEGAAELLEAIEEDEDVILTEADRDYLKNTGGMARHVPRDADRVAERAWRNCAGRTARRPQANRPFPNSRSGAAPHFGSRERARSDRKFCTCEVPWT